MRTGKREKIAVAIENKKLELVVNTTLYIIDWPAISAKNLETTLAKISDNSEKQINQTQNKSLGEFRFFERQNVESTLVLIILL